jgi:hypothetical protein
MTNRVHTLLREAGDGSTVAPTTWYETIYRATSTVEAHAGYGSIAGHLVMLPDRLEVREVREHADDDGGASLLMAASMVTVLGYHLAVRFGVDGDRFVDLGTAIGAVPSKASRPS